MSLHDLANQVQSAGRNDDKVLVHMTPGEVSGLQSLAMAHGGSLTVNPQTGLPEAGFLSSLLPMAIGFGLAPFTGGLSAALITGAGYTAATGSLKKGIMAGLGAYGGAGLASGLNAMGAQAASAGAGAGAGVSNAAATANSQIGNVIGGSGAQAANVGAGTSAAMNPFSGVSATTPTFTPTVTSTLTPSITPTAAPVAYSSNAPFANYMAGAGQTSAVPTLTTPTTNLAPAVNTTSPAIVNTSGINTNAALSGKTVVSGGGGGNAAFNAKYTSPPSAVDVGRVQADRGLTSEARTALEGGKYPYDVVPKAEPISRPFTDYMSQVGQGAKNVYAGGVQGLKDLYAAMPEYSVAAGLGGTGLSYLDERREEQEEEMRKRKAAQDEGLIRPYTFDYGTTNVSSTPYSGSAERTYFQPTYTAGTPYKAPGPEYAAKGGLMGLAVGGPVEEMAAQNAVGANMNYPMAALQTPMYSNPTVQRPEAMNVIAPSADAGVGSYTGEARFSNGGPAFMGTSGSSSTQERQGPKFMGASQSPTQAEVTSTHGPIFMNSVGSGWIGAGNYNERARLPGSQAPRPSWATAPEESSGPAYTYNYDPNTMQFTQGGGGGVSGGMRSPATNFAMQTAPAYSALGIPAYQTPEQQLGLGGFYDYMNQMQFARGGATKEPESSGYAYNYNPQTQQFTQTGGPGASKMPTGKELALGIGAMDMAKRFNEMAITGNPYNFTPSFMAGTTPNGTVSGGVAAPVMQPAAPAQPFVPNIDVPAYQTPEQQLGLGGFYDYMNQQMGSYGGYAAGGNVGGISHLGDYSDGGRLLKGPGDGVSDSIPASIGGRQPARLADGEFVVPARIVSEIGNGSTEAGARKLYAMMDRVQRARRKTVGKGQVAKNTKAEKLLPA